MRSILVTGSGGLIGSEVCQYFASPNWKVYGLDNNQRSKFFGPLGDTIWNQQRLVSTLGDQYSHIDIDIREREKVLKLIQDIRPDAIVHAAAQPSHDRAAAIPFDDFDTNAVGTFNLLEATRRYCAESPFIFLSTNKVYGDNPNKLSLAELPKRWEYQDASVYEGINETMSIDQCKHSLFGSSKVAADIAVQEYGRYFNMPTCCLRGGCLTGPNHTGVELHGFLSYLIKCNIEKKTYKIFGYKGKQVRDNIHSFDVSRFIDIFIDSPRSGEVYNIGGGRDNSCSILEAFEIAERVSGISQDYEYIDKNREGDHICYISDLCKIKSHYPSWTITKDLNLIFQEIYESWINKCCL